MNKRVLPKTLCVYGNSNLDVSLLMKKNNPGKTETPTKSLNCFIDNIFKSPVVNFVDEALCRRWTLQIFYPNGPHCPYCRSPIADSKCVEKFYAAKSFQCTSCNQWFTSKTGTFLAGSHLEFRQVIIMLFLIEAGLDLTRTARLIGVNHETVRRRWHNLKEEKKMIKQIKNAAENFAVQIKKGGI